MPLKTKISDLYSQEMIGEFQGYGFDVVGEVGDGYQFSATARTEFYNRHELHRAVACILISEAMFARLLAEGRPENNLDGSVPAGWIHFHPANDAPYSDETIGVKMAQRLRDGRAVTLTARTAEVLKHQFFGEPAAYCTWPLRVLLWLSIHRAMWSGRQSMIALRNGRARAKLRHFRIKGVGKHFLSL